jgi:Na+/H+-dicarboxylate symporter
MNYLLFSRVNTDLLFTVSVLLFVAFLYHYFWNIKEQNGENTFSIPLDKIGEQSEKLRKRLLEMKVTQKEAASTILLLEEVIVRFCENGGQAAKVKIRKLFGDVTVTISSQGGAYNPFASIQSWDTGSEDYYRDLIFRTYQADLSFSRRYGNNIIIIHTHRTDSRKVAVTFACMLLGFFVGLVMKWLPQAVSEFVANNIFSVIQTLFLNSLSLMLAPVVFFSISTSLSGLSGGKEMGRIGGKVVGTYFATTVVAIFIGFGLAQIFFGGGVPALPENLSALPQDLQSTADVSVKSLLLGIIPVNMVRPILEGNMLQIIFIAVLAGVSLSILGDKVTALKTFFNDANSLFLKMMEIIITFMPLVAFASMALLVFSCETATLFVLLTYLMATITGALILYFLYCFVIAMGGHVSPMPYAKKTYGYLLTPFTLASSSACIPMTIDFCQKRLGASKKISSFAIPLGATINMNGGAMNNIVIVILLAKMCGVDLDTSACIKIAVLTFLLIIGTPGVPNCGLVVIATILSSLGISAAALSFIIGIYNVIDRILTASNVNGDIAATVMIAASEKELDTKIYKE